MIVLIDNYDSFTYNLVQYIGEFDTDIRVFRNDKIDEDGVCALKPDGVVISPGPCTPNEAGNSCAIIEALAGEVPILGVCLGHQSIGAVFGGNVIRADRIMHGKVSAMTHTANALFEGVPDEFEATRYHSLIIERESCPEVLEVTAETSEGEIMAVAHRELPVWGLQFHPESILTGCGKQLISNFVDACRRTKT
ncbi:MAG: aminodeoxychorismate/anthranilate synthase component II [Candidatus Hydrogenedentota bacterium]